MEKGTSIWEDIIGEMTKIVPELADSLNKPAEDSEIALLESSFNRELPPAFKEYLMVFNGQNEKGWWMPLFAFQRFHPALEIIEVMHNQLKEYRHARQIRGLQEGSIRPIYWSKGWLPFADFECARMIIDFDPGKFGKPGQVIYVYPGINDGMEQIVVADSFEAFSRLLYQKLLDKEYDMEENSISFKADWSFS